MTGEIRTSVHSEILSCSLSELDAYVSGASRDAYRSTKHRTWRFAQANRGWLENVGLALKRLGHRSWIYTETGRGVNVLETSYQPAKVPLLTTLEAQRGFVSGYFDAEGGMPHCLTARLYFQFVQKDRDDLALVARCLEAQGIKCGRLHNPSRLVDADYWRFFVRTRSFVDFMRVVRSWHPAKRQRIMERQRAASGVQGPQGRMATVRSPNLSA